MKPIWIVLLAVSSLWAADQAAERGPLELSMKRAVELAVSPEGSARIQLSGEAFKQAQSRSAQARAALLPDLSAAFSDQSRTSNLAAMGLQLYHPHPRLSRSRVSWAPTPPWMRA